MNLRPLLHELVRQHGLDRKAAVQLFALAGFGHEPAALRTRLWPVVALLGAALGGRPHHRIGNRYSDLKELGHDAKNPAAL